MKTGLYLLLALSSAGMAATPDSKADEIARAMMQAMGGQEAWAKAHFLRFDFIVTVDHAVTVRRSHLWDKWTGRYRFEDTAGTGERAAVLFSNIGLQQGGAAYVAGRKLEGPAAARALKGAYGAFINDLYWLAMPWKWLDQGVHLKYLGRKTRNGKPFDVVALTFDHVGLTPGDRYEAYVSPATHLMEHWEYVLQGGQKGAWDWQYATIGGIKLASDHTNDQGASIGMGDVRLLDKVDDTILTDPSHGLSRLGK